MCMCICVYVCEEMVVRVLRVSVVYVSVCVCGMCVLFFGVVVCCAVLCRFVWRWCGAQCVVCGLWCVCVRCGVCGVA